MTMEDRKITLCDLIRERTGWDFSSQNIPSFGDVCKITRFWLKNAEEDDFVENGNRYVRVVDMCGGRYLLYENGEFCRLCDDVNEAVAFLSFTDN